jgi:hypothetical protein
MQYDKQDAGYRDTCSGVIEELTELRDGKIIPPASYEYNLLDRAMDKIREYESIMESIEPPEVEVLKESYKEVILNGN